MDAVKMGMQKSLQGPSLTSALDLYWTQDLCTELHTKPFTFLAWAQTWDPSALSVLLLILVIGLLNYVVIIFFNFLRNVHTFP